MASSTSPTRTTDVVPIRCVSRRAELGPGDDRDPRRQEPEPVLDRREVLAVLEEHRHDEAGNPSWPIASTIVVSSP